MSLKEISLEFQDELEPICVTEWSSNGVPVRENKIEFNTKTVDDCLSLELRDPLTDIKYTGEQFIPKYQKFAILVVDNESDQAKLNKCAYFRMKPKINIPNRKSSNLASLSIKEQLDEYNEKFGSKTSIKRIEQRKKFELSFDDDDYRDMKDQTSKVSTKPSRSIDKAKDGSNGAEILADTFLMPPRNDNASSIKEVYNINDILPENLISEVKLGPDFEAFPSCISAPLVKVFARGALSDLEIVGCMFLDILIKLKSFRAQQLNKIESIGFQGSSSIELKQYILENYTISSLLAGRVKRTLTDKCKDKIMIHGIILSIHLNHFKPLMISSLSQGFQVSTIKLRKLGNIVGCHVDVNKNKTERIFIFALPLYSMEKERSYKRRRTR